VDESSLPAECVHPTEEGVHALPRPALSLREQVETGGAQPDRPDDGAAGGKQSEAPRRLGLSRESLLERLKKYGPMTGPRCGGASLA
jgi:DNA-binding NtrC family response regulator